VTPAPGIDLSKQRLEIIDERTFLVGSPKASRLQRDLVIIDRIGGLPDQLFAEASGHIGKRGKIASERMEKQHALGFGRGRSNGGKEEERCGDTGGNRCNSDAPDASFGNERQRRTERPRLGRRAGPSPSFAAINVLHSDEPWDRGPRTGTRGAGPCGRNLEHGALHANRGRADGARPIPQAR
jgi:hypothetical protein